MLSHETTRRSFGARRDLPFSELLDAPTFPGPLDVSLAALETQCLVTLAEAFARLRAAVEAGDDAATVEARRALALTSGVSMYDIEGRTFTARAQAFVEECAQLLVAPEAVGVRGEVEQSGELAPVGVESGFV